MEIKQKVIDQKGQSIVIKPKGKNTNKFKGSLKWKSAVDLDLCCMYKLKNDAPAVKRNWFMKIIMFLFGWMMSDDTVTNSSCSEGRVYYGNLGNAQRAPFITLSGDEGVGDSGGNNQEDMIFHDMSKIESAIIVANIFNKTTSFSEYDGSVEVEGGNTRFIVPLSEKKRGSWCVVAKIDNTGDETKLINVNKVLSTKPNLRNF